LTYKDNTQFPSITELQNSKKWRVAKEFLSDINLLIWIYLDYGITPSRAFTNH
jgi:hypothetical protein